MSTPSSVSIRSLRNHSFSSSVSAATPSGSVSSTVGSQHALELFNQSGITAKGSPKRMHGRVKVGVRCRPPFEDEISFSQQGQQQQQFVSIIDTLEENSPNNPNVHNKDEHGNPGASLGQVSLTLITGRQRQFLYDYVFSPKASQDDVYERIARPVVTDVLKGFNGTIFAYGQTGTGKTYTMGILEFVRNEHAGIIPRSLSQIFETIAATQDSRDVTVSLSFLQLYRETIQDLLAPSISPAGGNDDNLVIREDPQRGFYVVGLQEFVVRNYRESEALINLGLENRAIAPTLMNSTSSRSHTVLTINIEQRISSDVHLTEAGVSSNGSVGSVSDAGSASASSSRHGHGHSRSHGRARQTPPAPPWAAPGTPASSTVGSSARFTRTLRSKLLLVDLAGSERVRRTVSKGTRLSEAKSINTSLSALGNVIAALAEHRPAHIPYRDSKLTRLLQDSLGGSASTALIATVGPAAMNYGETLSTLLFASRCMAVKTSPVQHAEVDYAEMCAALQVRVNEMEALMTQRLQQQQDTFEATIRDLHDQLEQEKMSTSQQQSDLSVGVFAGPGNVTVPGAGAQEDGTAAFDAQLKVLLDHLEELRRCSAEVDARGRDAGAGSTDGLTCWLSKPSGWTPSTAAEGEEGNTHHSLSDPTPLHLRPDAQQVAVLGYGFQILTQLSQELAELTVRNQQREESYRGALERRFEMEELSETSREMEIARMDAEDPRNKFHLTNNNRDLGNEQPLGSGEQKQPRKIGSHLAPMSRLDALRRVEGQFRSNNDSAGRADRSVRAPPVTIAALPALYCYDSIEDVAGALTALHAGVRQNLAVVRASLVRKDMHYTRVKEELMSQLVEKRRREEEVVNWSYILKYLLASTSKLRKQLRDQKRKDLVSSTGELTYATPTDSTYPHKHGSPHSKSHHKGAVEIYRNHAADVDGCDDDSDDSYDQLSQRSPPAEAATVTASGAGTDTDGVRDRHANALDRVKQRVLVAAAITTTPTASAAACSLSSSTATSVPNTEHQLHINTDFRTIDNGDHGEQGRNGYAYSVDDSDLSVTSTNRSIVSISTVGGGRYHSTPYQTTPVPRLNQQSFVHARNLSPTAQLFGEVPSIHQPHLDQGYEDGAHDGGSSSHRRGRRGGSGGSNATVLTTSTTHSSFARDVVQQLGVGRGQATAAMSVIDKVAALTEDQLAKLDPYTRAQIVQIRAELGLVKNCDEPRRGGESVHSVQPPRGGYGNKDGIRQQSPPETDHHQQHQQQLQHQQHQQHEPRSRAPRSPARVTSASLSPAQARSIRNLEHYDAVTLAPAAVGQGPGLTSKGSGSNGSGSGTANGYDGSGSGGSSSGRNGSSNGRSQSAPRMRASTAGAAGPSFAVGSAGRVGVEEPFVHDDEIGHTRAGMHSQLRAPLNQSQNDDRHQYQVFKEAALPGRIPSAPTSSSDSRRDPHGTRPHNHHHNSSYYNGDEDEEEFSQLDLL